MDAMEGSQQLPIPRGSIRSYAGVLQAREIGDKIVDPVTFFEDPFFLGRRTNPRRFAHQKIILKIFYGYELTDAETEWVRRMYEEGRTNYDPDHPSEYDRFQMLLLEVGQRSGKSFLGAGICLYEYYRWVMHDDPETEIPQERGKEPIAPGSPVEIKMVATSKENAADHPFAELQQFIEHSPWARRHFNIDKDIGTLKVNGRKGIKIRAGACTARGLRGGTGLVALLDELSWMVDTKGNVGGEEIYRAMRNTLKTLLGRLIAISSPRTEDDKLVQLGKQAKAGQIAALWFNLPSWLMDPSQSREDYTEEERTDPEGWDRDFNAHASQTLEAYFRMRALVDEFLQGIPHPGGYEAPLVGVGEETERQYHEVMRDWVLEECPVDHDAEYILAGDPAEKNDAFGYALLHSDKEGQITVDLVGRFIARDAEIDAMDVRAFFSALVRKFKVTSYVDDGWGFQETRQHLRDLGAAVLDKKVDLARGKAAKEAIYDQTHPVLCYEIPQLRRELLGIELQNGKKIEFAKHEGEKGHGDMAYALIQGIAEIYDPHMRHGDIAGA